MLRGIGWVGGSRARGQIARRMARDGGVAFQDFLGTLARGDQTGSHPLRFADRGIEGRSPLAHTARSHLAPKQRPAPPDAKRSERNLTSSSLSSIAFHSVRLGTVAEYAGVTNYSAGLDPLRSPAERWDVENTRVTAITPLAPPLPTSYTPCLMQSVLLRGVCPDRSCH